MLAKRYTGKKLVDNIFATSKKAKQAIVKFGKDNVINATIGSLYNEDEKLAVYDVVESVYRNLSPEDLYAYASNVIGEDDYLEEVIKAVFYDDYKEVLKGLHISSIATTGGTGAISNTIKNYMDTGDKVLLPNWMWGTYKNIVVENGGKVETYQLFDEKGNFNFEDFKSKVLELTKIQKNVVLIINEPSHNPTGFRMTYEEWVNLMDFFKSIRDTNVIVIRDVAYFEYDDRGEEETKKIRKLLLGLPKNILFMYAFSLSKSLSIYGKLKANFLNEKQGYMNLLNERANIFLAEAKEVNLETLPYKSGFFVTVSVGETVDKVIEDLENKNIFVIKFDTGIRIGLCSVPKKKIKGLAKKIKESIDKSKNQ